VNRLARETSPYLRQHADNPVDWYPWGSEAFDRAREDDKPILLSVGYSACHWCHVMAHESFENPDVAHEMNQAFVNVKVDREERPDVDGIYMQAVQAMTGRGGWPMTVFLTPDAQPFFAGTYFPPEDRHGMPGFPRVLAAINDAWQTQRGELVEQAGKVHDMLAGDPFARRGGGQQEVSATVLDAAYGAVRSEFDARFGGFGPAPKFPQAMTIELLVRAYVRNQADETLAMITTTLDAMAAGGMYDQLGGGFHRYSVDAYWLVPHFEKMLYDQALLTRVYLHAYLVTGEERYRRVVEDTIGYVLRELRHPEGVLFRRGRRLRGRGGQVLRLDAGRDRATRRRGRRRHHPALRRDAGRQLRGCQHPSRGRPARHTVARCRARPRRTARRTREAGPTGP
jgi:uncharacterized protein YyaL (SSP411 family)